MSATQLRSNQVFNFLSDHQALHWTMMIGLGKGGWLVASFLLCMWMIELPNLPDGSRGKCSVSQRQRPVGPMKFAQRRSSFGLEPCALPFLLDCFWIFSIFAFNVLDPHCPFGVVAKLSSLLSILFLVMHGGPKWLHDLGLCLEFARHPKSTQLHMHGRPTIRAFVSQSN